MVRPRSDLRVAKVLTEVFAPAVLVAALLMMSATTGDPGVQGVVTGFLAVLFVIGLPFGGVLVLTHKGRLSDHHVTVRGQRAPVLAGTLVSIACGGVVLFALDAPGELFVMVLAVAAGVLVVLLVNLVWKLSAHAAAAMFFACALVAIYGPVGFTAAAVPALVGWSRVRLSAHTPLQVFAGYSAGLLMFGVFLWLR